MILDTGFTVEVSTALAIAVMEGAMNYIDVLISDSMPLVGISFLSKFSYKAIARGGNILQGRSGYLGI